MRDSDAGVKRSQITQMIVGGATLAIFLGLVVYGSKTPSPRQQVPMTTAKIQPGRELMTVREDSSGLPDCSDPQAVAAVGGLLVRHSTAHVMGLTGISGGGDGDSRRCRATVNLDFGTQQVDYTIRRLASSHTGWELQASVD